MGKLEARRALITGGASGIGKATAQRFVEEGAAVTIVDFNEKAGKEVAGELGVDFVRADASDSIQVAEAFREASQAMGGIDVAYMNAGVTTQQPDFADLTDEQYFRILNINVNGVVFGVREAIRAMTPGGGSILATASLAGLVAYAGDPVYALTKHAVIGLVRGLGLTLPERGITINAICPGITETPLVGEEAVEMLKAANFPLIPPSAIAEACVQAIDSGRSGDAWCIQPGREPVRYTFHGVPGPRVEGAVGRVPPGTPGIS
ncbi:MAG TPA: SDR family NAD(P)-dependent oxidoreductase [Actinomycetota bacterium]|jgi:NAD(P)-dependent dehydrogenase (short-subunit alcohol dehydrogenase family)|nr:SDR family NAD(P)-dependent oxidoreductase [Actinomycetota bacterium]